MLNAPPRTSLALQTRLLCLAFDLGALLPHEIEGHQLVHLQRSLAPQAPH
jgi:hypothetical protein